MPANRLWAPWRLEYIKAPKSGECIFCKPSHVVHRGSHVFSLLNAFPYNNGHLMVAPYRHIPSIGSLDESAAAELMTEAQAALAAVRAAYAPDGFNLGVNEGEVAGAGFAEHVHLHVVPRWSGDTNFMPVLADTNVLPQSLEESRTAIAEAWA